MEIKIKEGVPLAGHFHLDVYRSGVLVAVIDEENLIVNGAKNQLARLVGGGALSAAGPGRGPGHRQNAGIGGHQLRRGAPARQVVLEALQHQGTAVALGAGSREGDRLDPAIQGGAQASEDQLRKILGYIESGKAEGAQCLTGGARALPGGEFDQGYFVQPTVFVGQNHMRIFQEEIFGPVLSVTTFKTVEEAIALANDTAYGLGAGVWTRSGNTAYRLGRAIEAGRGLDQLLSSVPRPCRLRRIQGVGLRA